jgi:peptidoglycan/xylan/chitin deacetylase (PgdA/CDA1 family)
MWFVVAGFLLVTVAHVAPFPFLLEAMTPGRSLWEAPKSQGAPTVYLMYDDGPNPDGTPALLDVLAEEGATATFFLIPEHATPDTAPIVRRAVMEGHALAMHTRSAALMLKTPDDLAAWLDTRSAGIEALTGTAPCRLFRPHAGIRGGQMYAGLDRAGYRLVGFGFSLWDFDWWWMRRPDRLAARLVRRVSDGSLVVMHDGNHRRPRIDRRRTIEATRVLVRGLKARGFAFGRLCDLVQPAPAIGEGDRRPRAGVTTTLRRRQTQRRGTQPPILSRRGDRETTRRVSPPVVKDPLETARYFPHPHGIARALLRPAPAQDLASNVQENAHSTMQRRGDR